MKRFVSTFALVVVFALLTGQAALAAPPQQGGGIIHYVQEGESLDGIAAQYGVSAGAIIRQNGLVNPDMIYAGQVLVIPGEAYNPGPMYHRPGGYSCANYYIVQMGDTLSSIAWNYGTTIEALQRQNNLYNADFVFMGQRLCVPAPAGYAPQPANYGNYGPAPAPPQWSYPAPPRPNFPCNNCGSDSRPRPEPSPCGGCDGSNCGGGCPPSGRPSEPCRCDGPNCGGCQQPNKPEQCRCDGPNCGGCQSGHKPSFELWFDQKEYEEWHRPAHGLTQCSGNDGPFDIVADPIQRITVAVFLSSTSPDSIPDDWASSRNVLFHTARGLVRQACVWSTNSLPSKGGAVNVTFYTHLEKGDSVKDIHFSKLGRCLSPNNGVLQPCDRPPDSVEGVVLPPFPEK